jgi:hypothetical protein
LSFNRDVEDWWEFWLWKNLEIDYYSLSAFLLDASSSARDSESNKWRIIFAQTTIISVVNWPLEIALTGEQRDEMRPAEHLKGILLFLMYHQQMIVFWKKKKSQNSSNYL